MDESWGNCQACHTRNVMVPQGSKNIGLDLVYKDNGVGAAFNNPSKNGQFSVPSLINVALTAPYMHDGRYKTLEEVVNFYSDSIKAHPNLDGFLREIIPGTIDPNNHTCDTCPPRKLNFTKQEKAALVAFMKTMTDTSFIKDPRWSDPFCVKNKVPVLDAILSLTAYPNPVRPNGSLNLVIISPARSNGQLKIYASNGMMVKAQNIVMEAGENKLNVPVGNLQPGVYVIQSTAADSKGVSRKILVQ
jgi:hypothetical protein